jgi:hypothetical protein
MKSKKIEEGFDKYVDSDLTNSLLNNESISSNLKWLPYIGVNYTRAPSKVLVVGKSHYDWDKTEKSKTQLNNLLFNLETIIWNGYGMHRWDNHSINDFKKKKFYRSLERIVFNTDEIYTAEMNHFRHTFWSSICFHQLIQNPMLEGWEHKDTKKTRQQGFKNLLEVIKILKPEHILMMSIDYKYENEFKAILLDSGYSFESENMIWKKSKGKDIRSTQIFKNDKTAFTYSMLVHPSSGSSNYNEQHNLLKELFPSLLKYVKN